MSSSDNPRVQIPDRAPGNGHRVPPGTLLSLSGVHRRTLVLRGRVLILTL